MKPFLIVILGFMMLSAGRDLIGTSAPEWNNQIWLNSPPLRLSELKGKVVFIRFFTDVTCPYCRASAPVLNTLHSRYGKKGLIVVGMYTPKPAPQETSTATVRNVIKSYGFEFPVALDNDWSTLRKYWLDRTDDAAFTSVSFLIDSKGMIRYIHPGGAYSSEDAIEIQKRIEELL
jgi:thiol-disulfide isomerase/thioredoxin